MKMIQRESNVGLKLVWQETWHSLILPREFIILLRTTAQIGNDRASHHLTRFHYHRKISIINQTYERFLVHKLYIRQQLEWAMAEMKNAAPKSVTRFTRLVAIRVLPHPVPLISAHLINSIFRPSSIYCQNSVSLSHVFIQVLI